MELDYKAIGKRIKVARIRMEIKDGKKVRVYKTSGKEVKGK